MGKRTLHLHYNTSGLILAIIDEWPETVVTQDGGEPFESMRCAIDAVLKSVGAAPYVPIGCPTPKPDGTCPGHEMEVSDG